MLRRARQPRPPRLPPLVRYGVWKSPTWKVRILRKTSGYAIIVSKVLILGITLTGPSFLGVRFAASSLGKGMFALLGAKTLVRVARLLWKSGSAVGHRKSSSNRTMCYVVGKFLLKKRSNKYTKNLPLETEEKRKKHQTILREATPAS